MFAYCGNNPIKRADTSGELWWVPGAIGAGISFISSFVMGGDMTDACIAAVEGFALAYVPDEIVHVSCGIVSAIHAWADGGSFGEGLGKGAISFLTSYVSGSALLSGANATKAEEYIIDLTFGFGAELIGAALSEGFFSGNSGTTQTNSNPFSNNHGAIQNDMPAPNNMGGGGGGGRTVQHLVLY